MARVQSALPQALAVILCLQECVLLTLGFAPTAHFGLRNFNQNRLAGHTCVARPAVAKFGLRMSEESAGTVDEATPAPAVSSAITASKKRVGPATLTEDTEWKLVCQLTGPPQDGMVGPSVEVACKVIFNEDEGYEPPQGPIEVVNSKYLGSTKAFWKLDEDPEAEGFDKAGFWIWGLFEEPKYPYMLVQMEVTQDIPLADGVVPAGVIYGQCKVNRDPEQGVTLTDGVLTLREPVKMKVDLLGLSEGILAEIKPVGTFKCTAL